MSDSSGKSIIKETLEFIFKIQELAESKGRTVEGIYSQLISDPILQSVDSVMDLQQIITKDNVFDHTMRETWLLHDFMRWIHFEKKYYLFKFKSEDNDYDIFTPPPALLVEEYLHLPMHPTKCIQPDQLIELLYEFHKEHNYDTHIQNIKGDDDE